MARKQVVAEEKPAEQPQAFGEPAPAEGFDAPVQTGPAEVDQPITPSLDAMGPPGGQAPLPGVATHEEVNRSVLKDSELKAAGKMLTSAKASIDKARDGMLDMVACGSEAPETLEKAAQLLKAAGDLVIDAHNRVRGAEV